MTKVLGITGGIGSGKTIVSQLLTATFGIPVYIADIEANAITANSPVVREKLIRKFGDKLYNGHTLNRKLLASIIFANEDHLKYTNAVIHPEVSKHFRAWINQRSNQPLLAIESAILFESGFYKDVDYTLNITAPLDIRINRVIQRDNSSKEAVLKRINNQLSDDERSRMSDFIIANDDTHAIIPQVESMINSLLL